jgi:DNA-binding winged helix-turn-helix (wHTH) protein
MVYRFGDFAVDTGTRQLLRAGQYVHLTPKAFEMLHLLLENRGRAVSKPELQQRIWPATFVEETNLASLVAEIRRALRDSAASPTFIGTVYGFGYRFVGAVAFHGDDLAAEQHPKLWLTFERRQIPLMEGENVIGRAPDAAIQIDAPSMSRYHARVVVTDGEATLEDVGSKNGTHLNGSRITTSIRLTDGDEIRFGAIALTFRTTSPLDATETVPQEGR